MSLLKVDDLVVHFGQGADSVQALHGVSLEIDHGEIVGLVGESGSGKTVTSLALMGLLDPRNARVDGKASFDGSSLWNEKGRRPSGQTPQLAMIFQEPMTALDPVFSIGHQLSATLRLRQQMAKHQAAEEAVRLLDQVGIPDPQARMRSYPHEMSGGMRQRVVIAIALACAPKLLIADEPTTAVDVTIQAQLLELIKGLARERGMAVLFVTHDLGVVSETCDRMVTMYAGRVVEQGPVREVLAVPAHPYTAGLLAALPSADSRGKRLPTIPGRVPPPGEEIAGCVFAERCSHAESVCGEPQTLRSYLDSRRHVRCVRAQELELAGAR
ncbi:ABC transporter ATP-binding protein [Cumulibacter soli]|uniref:ABC transporter ATP-binding protein n=1 Tax=Cumulibacter soli TaxID=2546344 RepID=UPI0014196504|nr:ABC transporter ATP-binding protein [Cumulibacter soli]